MLSIGDIPAALMIHLQVVLLLGARGMAMQETWFLRHDYLGTEPAVLALGSK